MGMTAARLAFWIDRHTCWTHGQATLTTNALRKCGALPRGISGGGARDLSAPEAMAIVKAITGGSPRSAGDTLQRLATMPKVEGPESMPADLDAALLDLLSSPRNSFGLAEARISHTAASAILIAKDGSRARYGVEREPMTGEWGSWRAPLLLQLGIDLQDDDKKGELVPDGEPVIPAGWQAS